MRGRAGMPGQRFALSALVTELSPLALLYAQMPLAFLCPQ